MRHGTGCLDGAVQIVSVEAHAGMKGAWAMRGARVGGGKVERGAASPTAVSGSPRPEPDAASGAAMSAVMLMPQRQPWSYTSDGMLIEPNPAPAFHEYAA